MSVYVGPWVEYRHADDCEQGGCPGHRVRSVELDYSEVIHFYFDEEKAARYVVDANEWAAMQESDVPFEQRKRYRSTEEAV